MPRSARSPAAAILSFFRKAPMENAELVLDLCRDALRERKEHGATIRAAQERAGKQKVRKRKQTTTAAAAQTAAPVARRKPGPKKGSKRKPRQKALPLQDSPDDPDLLAGMGAGTY